MIPATVFFDASSNSMLGNVKLAVWFSADANTFYRLGEVPDNPATTMINEHQLNDIDLASVPYSLVAGIAETVCDGREVPIASYVRLFAVLSTTYGGDGVTTFRLPDMKGRVPAGKDNMGLFGSAGRLTSAGGGS